MKRKSTYLISWSLDGLEDVVRGLHAFAFAWARHRPGGGFGLAGDGGGEGSATAPRCARRLRRLLPTTLPVVRRRTLGGPAGSVKARVGSRVRGNRSVDPRHGGRASPDRDGRIAAGRQIALALSRRVEGIILPRCPLSGRTRDDERPRGAERSLARDLPAHRRQLSRDPASPSARATCRGILPMALSPASVRNVMQDLEELGLVFAPPYQRRPPADASRPALLRRRAARSRRCQRGRASPDRGGTCAPPRRAARWKSALDRGHQPCCRG